MDILSGILYIFVKEYPQLTNSLLNQILIKNDFQPYGVSQQPVVAGESQTTILHLSKEQKQAFVKSILR